MHRFLLLSASSFALLGQNRSFICFVWFSDWKAIQKLGILVLNWFPDRVLLQTIELHIANWDEIRLDEAFLLLFEPIYDKSFENTSDWTQTLQLAATETHTSYFYIYLAFDFPSVHEIPCEYIITVRHTLFALLSFSPIYLSFLFFHQFYSNFK